MSMKKMGVWKVSTLVLGLACAATTVVAVRAYAGQPNMEAAIGHLEAAKASLEKAEHNKGGFRVKALEHVNQAIAATREGIAAGAK